MKICMFTNTYLPHVGGVAKSVATFTEDLRSMGDQVLVIAPTFDDREAIDDSDIVRVPAVQNFNASDFSVPLPIPFILESRLTEFEPDIIHSHHPFLLGDTALRTARRRGIPLIFTHHTRYEEYTHYMSFESETMRQFVINLSTEYANLCSRIVAPSESIADMLMDRGVVVPIDVIPTGVDLDFFDQGNEMDFRKQHRLTKEAKIVGHVGRLAPEKNLTFLTEAASLILKNLKDTYFLVVGDGSAFESVKTMCEREGISDRLIMTGALTGKELADAYRAMDLFIFSSLSETQGMVLVEAMAAQTPVVALDAPGAREVVRNGKNGTLLPEETSARDFCLAALEYLRNEEKLVDASREAIETSEYFSRRSCVKKLEGIYEKLLAHSFPQRREMSLELEAWDTFIGRLKTEWELLSGKASAATEALFNKQNQGGP